jgi:drug/metabolite transporter (DMT)-like permease
MSAICTTMLPANRRFDPTSFVILGVTIIGWAAAFPAIRAALEGFGPAELGALRWSIAAVPAALFLLATRPALPAIGEAWRFLYGGLVYTALYTVLLNQGEQSVSAGTASLIINLSPIITAIAAMLFLRERFGPVAWAGTAVSFFGIGLASLGEGGGVTLPAGTLLVLAAAICTALGAVVQKPLLTRHRALTVSAWNMVLGAIFLLPFLPAGIAAVPDAPEGAVLAVLFLGLVPSLIAYATWTIVLSRMPAGRASNFMYCLPPVATAVGFLWLGEVPSPLELFGGALSLAGVVLVNMEGRLRFRVRRFV